MLVRQVGARYQLRMAQYSLEVRDIDNEAPLLKLDRVVKSSISPVPPPKTDIPNPLPANSQRARTLKQLSREIKASAAGQEVIQKSIAKAQKIYLTSWQRTPRRGRLSWPKRGRN